MKKLIKEIPLAKNCDLDRFLAYYEDLLKQEEFKAFSARFQKTKGKVQLQEEKADLAALFEQKRELQRAMK